MSDVPTLQTLTDWANFGVVISLALSFVFGAASILLGGRLGKLKEVQAEVDQRNLELAVATQQERAAKAESELLELQQRTRDRALTPGLRDALISVAKQHPDETVLIVERSGANKEASDLARVIFEALNVGGWRAIPQRMSLISASPTYGLVCTFNAPERQQAAEALASALAQLGLKTEMGGQVSGPDAIILDVGLK